MSFSTQSSCDQYWEIADWLPASYILERWCKGNAACIYAKLQAILSACDRGEVQYRRNDRYTFDDPVHELHARGKLLIERNSFNLWCVGVEGMSPFSERSVPPPKQVTPTWAHQSGASFALPVVKKEPASEPETQVEIKPDKLASETTESESAEAPHLTESELRRLGVTADEIIEAFRVKLTPLENRQWWTQRFSNATRYKKILNARVQKGQSSRGDQHFPSWWNPQLIAIWLIDSRHMPRDRVVRVLERTFPDFCENTDYM